MYLIWIRGSIYNKMWTKLIDVNSIHLANQMESCGINWEPFLELLILIQLNRVSGRAP